MKAKKKVKIIKMIKKTAGGFHAWYETNVGIKRKPIQ
jgi:hypothetical protein